jgi:dihydrofolate synthase/folylpolyglutamate synthase
MNGYSAEILVQALRQYFPGYSITLIFGASADHPVRDMLKVLLPAARRVLATASIHHRSEKPDNLLKMAADLGYEVTPVPNAPAALEQVLTTAADDELICVAGSLFLVADVREAWLRRNRLALPPIDPQILYTESTPTHESL